ncbi:MAG: hypothetical protein IJ437_01785 [Clostridia bacterium]|nr:hypothetical protein [Clostridia bacterium]
MKKRLLIILTAVLLIFMLFSCGKTSTETDTQRATDTKTDIQSETNTETDTQTTDTNVSEDKENNNVITDSIANMTIVSKEHSYYTTLNEMEYKGEDFPNERGTYIKLIKTAEEFKTCFECENVEKTVLENNYILALKIHEDITLYSYKMIGCHNLEYKDGEYQISLDYYRQVVGDNEKDRIYPEIAEEISVVKFFVLPKTEVEAFDNVQNVKINKNLIDNTFSSRSYAKHYGCSDAPKSSTAWLITEENRTNLIESFNLHKNIEKGDLLVYFPFEMRGDISLVKAEMNGSMLNVVFENYTHVENEYVAKNDARYFLIDNFQAYQNVPDDYEVSITINVIYIPCITIYE